MSWNAVHASSAFEMNSIQSTQFRVSQCFHPPLSFRTRGARRENQTTKGIWLDNLSWRLKIRWIQCKKMCLQTKMLTILFKSVQTRLRASPLRSLWAITASAFRIPCLLHRAPTSCRWEVPEPKCAPFCEQCFEMCAFSAALGNISFGTLRYFSTKHQVIIFNTFELTCEWSTKNFS